MLKTFLYKIIYYCGNYFRFLTDRPFERNDLHKILIVAIGEIGDILRLFPFLKTLRENSPNATITLLTIMPCDHDIWKLLPESVTIDEKIFFDMTGIHESFLSKLKFIRQLRKKSFDLTIDTSRGSGMVANSIMNFLIGSKHRVGFQKKGIGFLHTIKVHFQEHEYIAQQNLRLLEAIGIQPFMHEIEIQLPRPNTYLDEFLSKIKKPMVSLHPGAKWNGSIRCWPSKRYAELATALDKEFNASVLILGDSSEIELAKEITETTDQNNILVLAGRTSLTDVSYIIKHSQLFIGNDSSLLHISIALKIPSIGIFGPTSARQVVQDASFFHVVTRGLPCSPCYTHQPIFSPQCRYIKCLEEVSVDEVMEVVRHLMKPCGNQ
jgi:lipopolysaccharide heptosyltransferase II